MGQNWDLDPATGDYLQRGGAPVETDSLRIPAYIRLKTRRLGWLYAPDTRYGSDLATIKKRPSTRNAGTDVENAAARALAPIAGDGRASRVEVDVVATARNGVGLRALLVDATGSPEQITLPSIGV